MKIKKSFFVFIASLLLSGGFSFAQTDNQAQDEMSTAGEIQEDHDTKKLDKLLIDYNKDAEKVLKDTETIQKEGSAEPTQNEMGINGDETVEDATGEVAGFKIFNKKPIDPKTLKEIKYSEAMKITLAPLQKMSEADLQRILKENVQGSTAEAYVNRFPKLALFAVRLIKDPDALPMLTKVVDNKDRLIQFSGIMICTILFAFFLKRLMRKEGQSVVKTVSLWALRFLIMTTIRIGIIYYYYGAEITPAFNVATKTFL